MPTRRSKVRGIDKYLSPKKSICRNEKKAGDYIVHSDAALDVKLLMALMKKKESSHLRGLVYVPKWILYAHDPRATQPFPNLSRAGLIISRLGSQFPVLSAPSTLCFEIERCRHLKKRFLVANMGIYVREYDSEDGHSNSIIIDVKNKVVERFDPHGRGGTETEDLKIEKLFKKSFPTTNMSVHESHLLKKVYNQLLIPLVACVPRTLQRSLFFGLHTRTKARRPYKRI